MNTPSFREAFWFWLKLGFISFGGPAGQIAIMHEELVERKKWIGETRFLQALNFCMLLPGPEAQQLATYCGWLLHRTRGAVVAGVLFVLPAAVLLWGLGFLYMAYGSVPAVAAIFYGLKAAVLAIVVAAVLRIGAKVLRNAVMWTLAAAAFAALFFLKLPFPFVVLGAGMIGYGGGRWRPDVFCVLSPHGKVAAETAAHTQPSWGRALRVTAVCVVLWWSPVVLAGLWQGWDGTLAQQGIFFSKAAMVTFGGAYAVLPYVAQQAVETHGWLTAPQMLDGLGLAETTPGPLIMVLQFVGFIGGWQHPGALSPLLSATLGAAMTTWVTFAPCFLWILLGAPHIEQLHGRRNLTAALSAITASIVGVILNLAVWFGRALFFPAAGEPEWMAIGIAVLSFYAMVRWKAGVIPVVLGGAALGLARLWI